MADIRLWCLRGKARMHLRKGNLSLPVWGSSNKRRSDRWLGIGIDLGNGKNGLVSLGEAHAQETTASSYNSSSYSCIPGNILHYANEIVAYKFQRRS